MQKDRRPLAPLWCGRRFALRCAVATRRSQSEKSPGKRIDDTYDVSFEPRISCISYYILFMTMNKNSDDANSLYRRHKMDAQLYILN